MNDIMDDDDKIMSKKQKQNSDSNTPVLDNFSRDLNKLAEDGKLDPVIGRDKEILRIAQILSRRKKNNPIIIGEPGCGKTAIVEGLAMKIVSGECPKNLIDKRIVNLDLTSVVAGTKYRGQFEERMKVIIEELHLNPNIIIFIDEIHTLVGSGNSAGSMDGSNIFKPALSRGELQSLMKSIPLLDQVIPQVQWMVQIFLNQHYLVVNYNVSEQQLLMNSEKILKKTEHWNVDSKR